MNELKFLGRGAGYNLKEGNTSAYIIKNETLLLIDCGETVFKSILEKNLIDGVRNIHILITHMHSDHIGSLSGFIGYCFWKYKIVTKVYFHEPEKILSFLTLTGLTEKESFIVNTSSNQNIDSLKLNFTSLLTKHSKTLNTYSYTLKFEKGNDIFYSGDTYETNFDAVSFLKEGNLIYHDTCLDDCEGNAHTSLRALSELIPKEFRKQVYCMHIEGENFVELAEKQGFKVVNIY